MNSSEQNLAPQKKFVLDVKKVQTIINLKSIGEVRLKYVSGGDLMDYMDFEEEKSPQKLVAKILFHQLLFPKLSFESFEKISKKELEELGRAFLKNEPGLFDQFKDEGDFFGDFQKALELEKKKRQESFEKIAEAALQSWLPIQKLVDAQKAQWEAIMQSLQPSLSIIQRVAEETQRIFDHQKQYSENEEKAAKILQKYKWFIVPSTPMPLVYEVLKLDGKKGRQDRAMNDLFIQFFSANHWQNLEIMVSGWKNKPVLRKRYKIIFDCLSTLKALEGKDINEANVILPTLITQIDGAFTDYLISRGVVWKTDYDDLIDRKTGAVIKVGRKSQLKKIKPQTLTAKLDEAMSYVFFDIFFQTSRKGTPLIEPFNFNRHKIIHGESVDYGRKDYLIRAFLLLDFLANL